jgi:hypothetical protein
VAQDVGLEFLTWDARHRRRPSSISPASGGIRWAAMARGACTGGGYGGTDCLVDGGRRSAAHRWFARVARGVARANRTGTHPSCCQAMRVNFVSLLTKFSLHRKTNLNSSTR